MIFSYFIWFTKTLVKVIVFMFLFVIKGNRLKIISQFKEYQSLIFYWKFNFCVAAAAEAHISQVTITVQKKSLDA